uniref:pentapeptide repeat-containing protein n=1 Tax=Candidatus Cryptobacteroides bacterium TaxID=3085639 RepID=UPI004025911A
MNVEELKKQLESGELVGEDLSDTVLDGVEFTSCKLRRVSFKGASLSRCRFRKADIAWCDFRYAHIEAGTFEDAKVDFCDFYRALFEGIVIFNHSIFSNCSFTKCYFGDSAVIRKGNLKDGRVLQQDKEAYRKFLCDWHDFGTGERQNDLNLRSDWSPEAALK